MPALLSEGLHLFLRWAHLITGIMWIGASIFFHWLDSHIEPVSAEQKERRPGLEGVLWMVHSGGFYEVEKKLVAPGGLPKTLHWFKWEAGFTWLTGIFLLVLLYHLGGGVMLLDPAHASISAPAASALCFGSMVVAWVGYDLLWSSPLAGKSTANPPLAVAISAVGLLAIALVLTHFLSGRAAYIHVAAVMGTCMVANVWVRIIPFQRHLVESVRAGTAPNADKAYGAKRRSKHNHYMTYPILFIMISNHFPSTYGASGEAIALGVTAVQWNWIVLVVLMAAGAMVKWWMNKSDPSASVLLAILGACVLLTIGGSIYGSKQRERELSVMPVATTGKPIKETGRIVGVVRWNGEVPPPKEVTLAAGCEVGHEGKLLLPAAMVVDGKLAEAFVYLSSGVEGYALPPPPTAEVTIEQKGCLYAPRVAAVRVGQPVTFVNDDAVFHNVRAVASANETWSVNQPAQHQRDTKVFRMPEVMVQTRCDLHPWMVANIGVAANPWSAVTAGDGTFVLEGVPAGEVVVEAWHEVGGRRTQKVTVPAGGEVTVELVFGAAP